MPEVKKLWIVTDQPSSVLTDPAIKTEEHLLLQFCGALDEGGYSMDKFLRIYEGTGHETWKKENTKVYTEATGAEEDAKKRLNKLRSRSERKSAPKNSAERVAQMFELPQRVAERFGADSV